MDNDHSITSDICAITGNNLEAVLFPDYNNQDSMIVTSDGIGNIGSFEGALCYDETTNEFVYVNMIQQNMNVADSLSAVSQSVFSALGGSSTSLADISTFGDGGQVMLLTNGSIVVPDDADNLMIENSNPFVLELVRDAPDSTKSMDSSSKSASKLPEFGKFAKPDFPSSNMKFSNENEDQERPGNEVAKLKKPVEIDYLDDELLIENKKGTRYHCKLCSKKFSHLKEYRMHLLDHKDKMHKCSYCANSFNKIKNLILHEAIHNPIDTMCPLSNCRKKFKRLASLKAHIKLHEEEETLTCSECGEEFRNQLYLELHYKYQPQCRVSTVEPAAVNVKSLSCKLCNRKFQDTNTLAAHKKEHEKIKKALAAKNHRKRPVISVPSSRINRCKECTKWFLKPSQLVRHMRIHTGERPFQCTECDKAFNQANSLKIHMLKHTGDRPYLCQFCHSGFSQRGNLRQHINRVHSIPKVEEHVYECSECPCIFKKMCSLNAHRNRVHQKRYYVSQNQEKPGSLNASSTKSLPILSVDNQSGNSINDDGSSVDKATLNGAVQKQVYSRKTPLPDLLTADESAAQSHLKTGGELEYRCPECPRVFEKSYSLNTHLHQIHQKQRPSSPDGGASENSITIENGLDDLKDEDVDLLLQKQTAVNTITISVDKGNGELWNQKVFITKKRNTRYYQCSHCPKQSIKLNEIIRHLKLNMMGKLFKCDYCTKTFSQHSVFLTHLTLHATAKMYECSMCQQTFSNPAELKMHSKNHVKAQNDYMCMICFKSYSPNEIANHQCLPDEQESQKGPLENTNMQRVHDKISLILPPYNCRYCNVTFDSYSKLKTHLHEHDANLCEICCLLFPSKEKLKEHAISHKEEDMKDLMCKICGKKFRTKRQCDVHLKAHSRNRQNKTGENKCSLCGKTYKDPTTLKRHLKKIHASELEAKSMNSKNSVIESVSSIESECNAVLPLKEVSAQDMLNSEPIDIQNSTIEFVTNEDSPVSTMTVNTNQPVCDDIPIETAVSAFEDAILCDDKKATNTIVVNDATLAGNLLEHSDSITLSNRTNIPDLLTIDSLEDCFLNVQANGLPLESEIDSVPSVYSIPGAIMYRCTKCSQQYSAELDLQKHFQESEVCNNGMLNTAVSYFYACSTCYLTFKSLESFLKHLQTHDGNRTFLCLYCGAPNRTEAELTQHIAQHSLNKEYPCLHCGELSSSAESVKKHITDIHLMSSSETKTSETKRKKNAGSELLLSEREKLMLVCQKPNKFSSISERVLSSLLKEGTDKGAHGKEDDSCGGNSSASKTKKKSLSNVGSKENTCSYCGRVFKKMSDLVRHVRTHTGEKPFKCDYCNKCFTVKSILNCHLKTHFTVKNICCHICNRFFATVGSLKIHMRLHTGDRPYQCLYCKETFRTSGHRESHQKRHLGEKDRAKATHFIAPDMMEIDNDDCLNLPLAEDINLDDSDFILPDITVSEFHGLDLGELNNPPISKPTAFDCSVCGKLFGRKWDLKKHMNVHFPERGYSCTICDAKFNQQYALKQHLRRHIPLPAVVCDVCHKNFASSANLKVHKVRLHPETLNLPVQDANEPESPPPLPPHDEISVQTSAVISDAGGSMSDSDRDSVRWADQGDLNLSILVGKNKKTDSLNDFFVIEKQFDLSSMMSDLFPDDDK